VAIVCHVADTTHIHDAKWPIVLIYDNHLTHGSRWTMSLEPKKFQKTKARPKERRSDIRFPCREQAMSVASPQGCQKARSPVTCVALVVAAACGVSAGGMTRLYCGLSLLLLSQK